MRLFVVIASIRRAEILVKAVDRLSDQTRKPDGIVVSVTNDEDCLGIENARTNASVIISPTGSCIQRNLAIDFIGSEADVLVFFDDDFVPALDYLENVEHLMHNDPDIVGLTGCLVADGIHGKPIAFEDAVRRLDIERERPEGTLAPREALYGCNMAISRAAIGELRFDENLPLYGWQEDIDFTYPLGRKGKLLASPELTGIHLGARGGRQPGRRLGYSQVANIVYLSRKGTMQPGLGRKLLINNLLANVVRSFWPESGIDRRGRLIGNLMAIGDIIRGTVDPRRVTRL